MILKQKRIYRTDLQAHPDVLYLFGDNEERRGLGGQAIEMRGEPNAIGVRTKRRPRLKDADFWTDETLAANCRMIDEDLVPVRQHLATGGTVVLPEDGLGTGLAQLQQRAPQTFAYLTQALESLS
ncbi:hypothetical protein MUN84_11830 [Hymenobacter sp. 5516J-16]|uniref:DUF7831 domain-containing protein n=1 Tax=Hymenobacter sp. 5516J-16 TaxID=2932253 RepID=UPI001FD2C767|nr:hypothetical protein [Hymenobacter sp. 5516J-16]UOQ75410.1 hypothetical protein MUN84_11830 [Hymenobacter sp. 5516J-16]